MSLTNIVHDSSTVEGCHHLKADLTVIHLQYLNRLYLKRLLADVSSVDVHMDVSGFGR